MIFIKAYALFLCPFANRTTQNRHLLELLECEYRHIKGEYNLEKEAAKAQERDRERALSGWLMEMGW